MTIGSCPPRVMGAASLFVLGSKVSPHSPAAGDFSLVDTEVAELTAEAALGLGADSAYPHEIRNGHRARLRKEFYRGKFLASNRHAADR